MQMDSVPLKSGQAHGIEYIRDEGTKMLDVPRTQALVDLEAQVDEDLDVQTLRTGKRVIVRVSGDAGLATVSRLEAELTNIASTRPPLVIVDLTALRFIASRGMGVLMGFHRRMTLQKGKVRVAVPPSRVRDALEIARLHNVLEMYDSVEEALRG
jgi:anti-sigma B factor antagonist